MAAGKISLDFGSGILYVIEVWFVGKINGDKDEI